MTIDDAVESVAKIKPDPKGILVVKAPELNRDISEMCRNISIQKNMLVVMCKPDIDFKTMTDEELHSIGLMRRH